MTSTYSRRCFLKIIGGALVASAIPPIIDTVLRNTVDRSVDLGELTDLRSLQFTHIPRFEDAETVVYRLNDQEETLHAKLNWKPWDSEGCDPVGDINRVLDIGFESIGAQILYVSKGTDEFMRKKYGKNYGSGFIKVYGGTDGL